RYLLALLEVRVVPVIGRDIARADVRVAGQCQAIGDGMLALYAEQQQLVLGLVGTREDRVPIDREQLRRRSAVTDQIRVDVGETRLQPRARGPPGEVAKERRRVGRAVVAPTALRDTGGRPDPAQPVVHGAARLYWHADSRERAGKRFGACARMRETVLRLDPDRT